jgi:CarD family transcriptional regulator
MARKPTPSKSAASKADAKKHKASPRSSSHAKPAPRKEHPAAVKTAKPAAKPAAVKVPLKKPVPVQAKPAAKAAPAMAKPAGSPAAPASKAPAKAVPPKVPAVPFVTRMPPPPPRQFGQPAAALAAAKGPAQKAMPTRQAPAPSKQAAAPATAAAAAAAASKKAVSQRHGFKTNEYIVYPAHGVGRIVGIEEQEIAGMSLELFVITFDKDKMTLRVPTGKSASVGMRKLAEEGIVKRAMETLKGRARIKRTMWSRRAQEYEAKINSGDLVAIAEVVRDLYRSESQPEQSYSERQLYEAALDRMAREIAAVEKLDERGAVQRITDVLSKSAKGRRATAEEAEVKAA